jgi:hypothetical protein
MKPIGRALVLLCVVLTALLLPTGAAASSKPSTVFQDGYATAHLAGTHGYRITILAFSRDIIVTAKKGTASVSYVLLRNGLKGDRIHARLPGVGRVFLEFHDRRHPRGRPEKDCGESETTRKGVFVGTVKIEGERGYTSALSHHVRGEIGQEGCHRRPTARASSAGSRLLSASTSRGNGRLSFTALNFPWIDPELLFDASFSRARGQMAIITVQSAMAKHPTDLEIAAPPRSASVTPPAPFTGSASFQQEAADQFSWSGDLAVELPGVGEVSLAGPKFETSVCVGQKCRGDKKETESNSIIVEILG